MRTVLSALMAVPLFSAGAFGWGCEGHQMVALIARAHLSLTASAAVDELLRDNAINPLLDRYCKDRPADLMADSSTWADDVKQTELTGEWHYINVPLAATAGDPMQWCRPIGPPVDGRERPGCIVNAIGLELNILGDRNQPGAARAMALRYIIHLLGDLTQPLHDSDNHDEGGNCTRLRFFSAGRPLTLHTLWDSRIIASELEKEKASQAEYAAIVDREFADRWPDWGLAKFDVKAWVWEGHNLASSVTYGALKPAIPMASIAAGPADSPACDRERDSVEALHINIGRAYVEQAFPVIREQVAKGGFRLAALLNQVFP